MLHVKDSTLTYGGGREEAAEPFAWLPSTIAFLSRSRKTIVVSTGVVLLLGILYLVVVKPKFDADADVLIDLRQTELFRQQNTSTDAQVLNAIVESQVEILKSNATALAAIRRLGPQVVEADLSETSLVWSVLGAVTNLFSSGGKMSESQMNLSYAERLMALRTVKRVGITNIIEVTVRTTDPERSARLANALVQSYISDQLEAKYETTRRGGAWLQTRLSELRDQATNADKAVQEYKATMKIVDTDKGLMSERQVGDLNASLIAAQSKTAEAKARYDRIRDILSSDVKDGAVADLAQNQVIVRLRQQYFDTAKREADISSKYGQNHVAAVNARAEMAELEKSLRGELQRTAESYRSDYEVARSGEENLRKQLDTLVSNAAIQNRSRVELRSLESSSQTYRALYENFLQKYTQAVQDQSFPISEARVVAPAEAPLRKSWPKPLVVLAGALAAGVFVGIAFAFLRELLLRTIKTANEVEQVTGLPCIATVPRIRSYKRRSNVSSWLRYLVGAQNDGDARAFMLDTITHPLSATSETMREIKLVAERHQTEETGGKVIGIVSAISGEGKSTIASNLAHQFAQASKRVIVLDWDLRHPFLSRTLLPDAKEGLLEAINACQPLGLFSLRTRGLPLFILPTIIGEPIEHTAEVLRDPRNIELLNALKTQYDVIIVDFPPMADFIDVRATSDLVDAYLLVVGYDRVQKSLLAECVSQGKLDTSRVIGAVLNGVDPRQHERKQTRLGRYMPWVSKRSMRYAPPPQKAA